MKIVIYTSITPGYDPPRDDVVNIVNDDFHDPARGVRAVKILSHRYVRADISVWIDGNVHLKDPIWLHDYKEGFDPVGVLGDNDIVLFKHPTRDCIYDEFMPAKKRLGINLNERQRVNEQISYYRDVLEFGEYQGLWFGGFIIRRHNERVEWFNNMWWAEVTRFSYRDQLSLPIALARCDVKLRTIDESIRDNWLFRRERHGKARNP